MSYKKQKLGRRKLLQIEEDKRIQRRIFLKRLGFVGVASLASIGSYSMAIQGIRSFYATLTQCKKAFVPGHETDLKSLSKMFVKLDETKEVLSEDRIREYFNKGLQDNPRLQAQGGSYDYVGTLRKPWIKLDNNPEFAKYLVKESRNSIDHIIDYTESPELKKIHSLRNISFHRLRRGDPFFPTNARDLYINLVSEFGEELHITFKDKTKDVNDLVTFVSSEGKSEGKDSRDMNFVHDGNYFQCKAYANTPIWFATVRKPLSLVETPPIEVLHKYLTHSTIGNLNREIRKKNLVLKDIFQFKEIGNRHTEYEEKLVHAISIPWLRQYNRDRNIGFTNRELQERFNLYEAEHHKKYHGTNKLSEHIQKISIPKAISLYINNYEDLFGPVGLL